MTDQLADAVDSRSFVVGFHVNLSNVERHWSSEGKQKASNSRILFFNFESL